MEDRIELKEMIAQLRHQLDEARKAGDDSDLRFKVQSVDLELQVVAERSGEGKTGIKFWVVAEAGSKAAFENRTTQTIKLKLVPDGEWGGQVSD